MCWHSARLYNFGLYSVRQNFFETKTYLPYPQNYHYCKTNENYQILLIDCNPQLDIYKIIGKIKGYTSNILRNEFPELKSRIPTLWTRSKFISTVGSVSLEVVKKYIESQKSK